MNPAVNSQHETQRVSVVEADIDIEIINFVQLLGTMQGVMPLWSCQGDDASPGEDQVLPYVSFDCWSEESLQQIKILAFQTALETGDTVSFATNMTFQSQMVNTMYTVSFDSKQACKTFHHLLMKCLA